ncbi:DUF896 domain-containing protein [Proteinivorax hydrogeniformans]|uniref:UPF0291 protein PRVXH_001614 n=1 Tax=Proteinivorax hydrogeniformans TaxID=1826727 RepID=A0AAU8HR66_9FIRM
MLSREKILRINELAKKKKTEGLTPAEAKEQQKLRAEYISAVKGRVNDTIKNTKFVDEKGNEVKVTKRKKNGQSCGCGCGHH